MADNEKATSNPTPENSKRMFTILIGRGPKQRAISFIPQEVESNTEEKQDKPKEEEDTTKKNI